MFYIVVLCVHFIKVWRKELRLKSRKMFPIRKFICFFLAVHCLQGEKITITDVRTYMLYTRSVYLRNVRNLTVVMICRETKARRLSSVFYSWMARILICWAAANRTSTAILRLRKSSRIWADRPLLCRRIWTTFSRTRSTNWSTAFTRPTAITQISSLSIPPLSPTPVLPFEMHYWGWTFHSSRFIYPMCTRGRPSVNTPTCQIRLLAWSAALGLSGTVTL